MIFVGNSLKKAAEAFRAGRPWSRKEAAFSHESDSSNFWQTIEPQRMSSRNSSTDMQMGTTDLKFTTCVLGAEATGRNNGAHHRRTNLATVSVPSQHQIKSSVYRPVNLIGRMRKKDLECIAASTLRGGVESS